jgi:hypothetical protein
MITPFNNGANYEAWSRNIMHTPTDKVSIPAKNVAIVIVVLVNDAKGNNTLMWDRHCKVYDWQIANELGMDRRSIVRLRKQVEPCFSILQRREWNEEGKFWNANYYLPGDNILLGILDVNNERHNQYGQRHYTCKNCGSERVEHIITHTFRCLDCMHVEEDRKGEMLWMKS